MPSDSAAKRLPSDALDAFLDGVIADLRDPADPDALNEVRAAFRRRVPLTMRSYAAALLILRAAGLARTGSPRSEGLRDRAKDSRGGSLDKRGKGPDGRGRAPTKQKDTSLSEPPRDADRGLPRPRFSGEATTLFFSMGKRQRLYPRLLIDLIIEEAKLSPESIGDVRAFDNYSFADIDPAKAQAVISALDGSDYRGRKLSVGPAKRREAQEKGD